MSTFSTDRIPDLPVLLVTVRRGFHVSEELHAAQAAAREHLAAANEPLFNIVDISDAEVGLAELVAGSARDSRAGLSLWQDPQVRETIFITGYPLEWLPPLGFSGLTHDCPGVKLMADLDSVIDYVRAQISVQAN